MAKKKQEKFSVTKAVKRNARERVGQPKPAKGDCERATTRRRERRHKEDAGRPVEARGIMVLVAS